MVLPPASEWLAPAGWQRIDLISDLHLCEAMPRTFGAWAAYMRQTPADAVLILGDLFEFWPGSDAVQLGFEAACAEVLRTTAARCRVGVMVGNRDFLLTPEFLIGLGVQPLAEPTLLCAGEHRVLLTHGDALCLADQPYQQFRAWVRNPATQAGFLAKPLAERVRMGASVRHASEAGRQQAAPAEGWADLDFDAAVACLQAAGSHTLLHGHTHRPGDSPLRPGFSRIVLSDWDLDGAAPRAEVLRLTAGGFSRLSPEAAAGA